jgi:hypothetical protein
MALYLISYDIAEKDKFEYGPLWAKLKQIDATKILYSEWVVADAVGKASEIYGELAPLTLLSDRLLVQEVTNDARWDKLLISDDEFDRLLTRSRG